MKWMEQINRNEIPKNYQEAFKNLGNKLIFTEQVDIDINKENIKLISQKIQEEYIHLDESSQDKRREETNKIINSLIIKLEGDLYEKVERPIDNEDRKFEILNEERMKLPLDQFLKSVNDIPRFYVAMGDDRIKYYNWGFTPRLAKEAKDLDIGKNCFGTTTFVGSLCKKRGLSIDMGITPDHPYVIAYLPDGPYILDGQSEIKKMEGKLEDYNGYKIYRPNESDDIFTKMILIQNFDDAVVYEILENIEVLRQVSMGNKDVTLPGSYDEGENIALKNKDVLQKINWKDLQSKLFPEINQSFSDHNTEWKSEVERVASERKRFYVENIFIEIAKQAQKETSFNDLDFKEGQKALGPLFKKHGNEIIQYLKNGIDFNDFTPKNIKNYFSYLKNEVEKQKDKETKIAIYNLIENKLVDKTQK